MRAEEVSRAACMASRPGRRTLRAANAGSSGAANAGLSLASAARTAGNALPVGDRGRAGTNAEFGVDPVDVVLYGFLRDGQRGRDLGVGVSLGDQRHDFRLAGGQAGSGRDSGNAVGTHATSGSCGPVTDCDGTHDTELGLKNP